MNFVLDSFIEEKEHMYIMETILRKYKYEMTEKKLSPCFDITMVLFLYHSTEELK